MLFSRILRRDQIDLLQNADCTEGHVLQISNWCCTTNIIFLPCSYLPSPYNSRMSFVYTPGISYTISGFSTVILGFPPFIASDQHHVRLLVHKRINELHPFWFQMIFFSVEKSPPAGTAGAPDRTVLSSLKPPMPLSQYHQTSTAPHAAQSSSPQAHSSARAAPSCTADCVTTSNTSFQTAAMPSSHLPGKSQHHFPK